MTPEQVAQLKQNNRIEDLVAAAGLTVVGKGKVLTTQEHDSLKLFRRTNSWYWYQQGVGGSVIDWIMHTQHTDFASACETLLTHAALTSSAVRHSYTPPAAPAPLPADLHVRLHKSMSAEDISWWLSRGISETSQTKFNLGVYHHYQHGACYSIPVIEAGILVNIRLRIAHPVDPKDKYRPYDVGRGTHLFNSDALTPQLHGVMIVAGELKCVLLDQYGFPAVSPTAGCGHWRPEWTERLKYCKLIYIAFDPGEEAAAARLAEDIGGRARMVTLPQKPDDFVLAEGADALRYHLKHAEPLAKWRKQRTVTVPDNLARAFYRGAAPITPSTNLNVPWRRQLWQGATT